MFFFLFPIIAFCLVEKLTPEEDYTFESYVVSDKNTVHFIQSELHERFRGSFHPVSDKAFSTEIKVFEGDSGNEVSVVHNDEKKSQVNTFFFTASNRDTYYIFLKVLVKDREVDKELGMNVKIFSGEANRPNIVSNNDVEVSRAENMVGKVLEFVKHNIFIQEMDEEGEQVYKKLYEEIMRKVVYVLILKISATVFTMYYSNRKTKSFYASQGLGVDK